MKTSVDSNSSFHGALVPKASRSRLMVAAVLFAVLIFHALGQGNERSVAVQRTMEAKQFFAEGEQLYRAGDMPGAFALFLQAAKIGLPEAQLQVGWHYEKGQGVLRDEAQAAHWYELAAMNGNARAMKNLGNMYEFGKGVPEDWIKAAQYYQFSAQAGQVEGEVAFADAYRYGIGVPQDRAAAIQWYQRAAQQGDAQAAHDARWLREPTNNIGFRDEKERDLVMGNRLRTSGLLLGGDPAGIRFRNSQERSDWLAGFRGRVDSDEADSLARQRAADARHNEQVRRLMNEGYSKAEAETKAGY